MAVSATHLEFDPFVFMFSGSYYEQVHLCSLSVDYSWFVEQL